MTPFGQQQELEPLGCLSLKILDLWTSNQIWKGRKGSLHTLKKSAVTKFHNILPLVLTQKDYNLWG